MARKPNTPTCGWSGHQPSSSVDAVLGVVIQRACAHGRTYVPTCAQHKATFDQNGGVAENPSTCDECGHRGHASIIDTYQVGSR